MTNEFNDIEQLLKPQCDFKASESLKEQIIEEARHMQSKPRTLRILPWIAAACVAAVLVVLLMPPQNANPIADNISVVTKEEKAAPAASIASIADTNVPIIHKKEEKAPIEAKALVRRKKAERHQKRHYNVVKEFVTEEQSTEMPTSPSTITGPLPMAPPAYITMADLPITHPENLKDTPEELLLKEKLELKALCAQTLANLERLNNEISKAL